MERLYITKIENAFRGLRLGTKTPHNCEAQKWIDKLRTVNSHLAEDFVQEYEKQKAKYNRKHNNQYSSY